MELQEEQVGRNYDIRARSGAQVSRDLECCPAHLTPCRRGRGRWKASSGSGQWSSEWHSWGGKGEIGPDRRQESRRGGLTLSPSFLRVFHHLSVVDWNTVVVID